MIKVISFDLDGTLLDKESFDMILWYKEIPRLYAQKQGISFEEAKEIITKAYAEIGPDDPNWYSPSFWFRYFKLKENPKTVLEDLKQGIKLYPEVKPVLADLHKKFKLIVLTQSSDEFIELKMGAESIKKYFDHVFSTIDDFNLIKKSPDVYQALLNKLGVEKHEIVHVGDSFDFDFRVPQSFGIKSFYLSRNKELKGDGIIHSLTELQEELEKLEK